MKDIFKNLGSWYWRYNSGRHFITAFTSRRFRGFKLVFDTYPPYAQHEVSFVFEFVFLWFGCWWQLYKYPIYPVQKITQEGKLKVGVRLFMFAGITSLWSALEDGIFRKLLISAVVFMLVIVVMLALEWWEYYDAVKRLRVMRRRPCQCNGVEIGSYGNQVELPRPDCMQGRREGSESATICVDRCLQEEIELLWKAGIRTTGCCCGHAKVRPYIGVIDEDIPMMLAMGYVGQANFLYADRNDEFKPKSV